MKQLEIWEKENGSVEFDGKKYILRQQPYIDCLPGEWLQYAASAVCVDDKPNEDEYMSGYEVRWYATDDAEEKSNVGEYWDERDACDWDHPDSVRPTFVDVAIK